MSTDTLCFLGTAMQRLQPRRILEFGSGSSTELMAGLAAASGETAVTSVEHDPFFLKRTSELLADRGVESVVDLCLAHIVLRIVPGGRQPIYLTDPALETRPRADFIVVDGPPAVLGGREGVLHQALICAKKGAVIIVDDAGRDADADAVRRVAARYAGKVRLDILPGFERGLAVLTVTSSVARRSFPATNRQPSKGRQSA